MSSLRPNIPAELYVSALANPHSGLVAPLLPGAKGSPLPSSALSPTVKATLLPSAAQSLTAPNPLVGRSARSHGSRGAGHGHGGGGRIKQLPTWMDAPDDLFFHSTQITKWVNSSSYLYSKSVSSKQMSMVWNLLTFLWLFFFCRPAIHWPICLNRNRKLRRQLATQELRRAARKPWRPLTPRKA